MTQFGRTQYENRLVAYIDILGFKELVARSVEPNPSVTPTDIKKILELPGPAEMDAIILGRIGDIAQSGYRMTAFSDCAVLSTEPTEQGLIHLLHHVGKIGFNLVKLKCLCYGYITMGPVYHDNDVLFGPAFIDAYTYIEEDKKEPYARVVLGEDVVELGLSADPPVDTVFKRFTRKDDYDKYYANILRVLRMYMDMEGGPPPEVRKICSEIEDHLAMELERLFGEEKKRIRVEWFKKYFEWATDRSTFD